MKSYLKRFASLLFIAVLATLGFFGCEIVIKKMLSAFGLIDLSSLSPEMIYISIVILLSGVFALRES